MFRFQNIKNDKRQETFYIGFKHKDISKGYLPGDKSFLA